jgi:GDP-L-fucose synthase
MKVLVTGANGMLGRSLLEQFHYLKPDYQAVGIGMSDVDLRDKGATEEIFRSIRPDVVVHTAAKVGGMGWKVAEPTSFLLDNILIDSSVISASLILGISEMVYLGSAAVYPAEYSKPLLESDLMTGKLEAINEGYALAKTVGLKLCEYANRQFGHSYRAILPSNLYGLYDNFEASSAHLIAAALRKLHSAKQANRPTVDVWGDGSARREFTFSVDLAKWIVSRIGNLDVLPTPLNIGAGVDYTVAEYYEIAKEIVGFSGDLNFDLTKPAGVPRRLIDSSLARALGWAPSTDIREGIRQMYGEFLSRAEEGKIDDEQ